MIEFWIYFLIALIFLALGYIIGLLVTKNKLEKQTLKAEEQLKLLLQEKETNKNIINSLNEEKKFLSEGKHAAELQLVAKDSFIKNLEEKLANHKDEVNKLQEKFTKDFELLATKILEEKSSKFTTQNKENLKQILSPLQEKIQNFEKKVEATHKESIDYHAALRQQIFGLKELNEQMSKETVNLTKALKGETKTQGNWGELVLERVLEKSGLEKDREYFVQQNFVTEEGKRVLPDVIIHLPDNKKMVIDSKVSLTAYERYINADDDDTKAIALKDHLLSLKRHIEQLSAKKYEDIYKIESPDFVLLFIPIETAFAIAVNSDHQLYNKAFERNIVVVTPSTLLATLRTIDTMWNNEKQHRNAQEISRQAAGLYDKFRGLITDLTGIGKRLDDAKKDYSGAMNKLVEGKGNLIRRVENLRKLGVTPDKSLPQNIIERATEDDL